MKRRIVTLLLALCMVMGLAVIVGAAENTDSGSCGESAVWAFDAATGTLTISGTGSTTDYADYFVHKQAPWKHLAGKITTVVVEEGITRLGDYSFASCTRLIDVRLPESLTELGNNIFDNCDKLTGVKFPDALTTIGGSTFFGCDSLETFVIPESITVVPESTFNYCTNLKSVVLHDGVTSIGYRAFACCRSLTEVDLPKNLVSIGGEAFLDCDSITSMEWPASATTISGGIFSSSGLQELVLPDTVTTIGAQAFMGCTELKTVNIPDSVTSIGERAFESTRSLQSIRIPAGVTAIPMSCFTGSGIAELSLSEGLTTIGRYAFQHCSNLKKVVLPESLTSIESQVFSYCSSLAEINWPSGVDTIGWHQFSGTALVEFTVPATVKEVQSYAFKDCTKLEKLVFESRDTKVSGSQIFENTPLLTIWCWYDSSAQDAAEFQLIPYVLFDPPADLPRYPVYTTIYGDGSVIATPADSTGFEWITVDLVPGPDSVLVGMEIYYYAYEELELRAEEVDEDTFRLLMPKCPVEIVAVFQNTITGFIDIRSTDFFYEPVIWAFENNITTGISNIEFGPTQSCNRAQVVTFLWRAAGCPAPTSTENPFEDVKESDFYYDAVLWAVENGITNGVDATHFGPFVSCNRAQVVTFLYRAMQSPEIGTTECPFTDVEAGQWYENAVLWAVENGITNGMSADTFGVDTVCNRAQVVTFLYRTYVD